MHGLCFFAFACSYSYTHLLDFCCITRKFVFLFIRAIIILLLLVGSGQCSEKKHYFVQIDLLALPTSVSRLVEPSVTGSTIYMVSDSQAEIRATSGIVQ